MQTCAYMACVSTLHVCWLSSRLVHVITSSKWCERGVLDERVNSPELLYVQEYTEHQEW